MRAALAVLLAAACSDEWNVVHSGLPAALFSVAGTSASDVWAVGGDVGEGPLVLRYDGATWRRVATGMRGDLWWIHVTGFGRAIAGGANGRVLRIADDVVTAIDTPGADTVFGTWVDEAGAIWAVGGDTSRRGFAWRYAGSVWDELALPDSVTTLYKVWGTRSTDVWAAGAGGVILRWDGRAFRDTSAQLHDSEKPLFTVHGSGARVAAVGGFASGLVAEWDGGVWREVGPQGVPRLSGVFLAGDEGWAVGNGNTILARTKEGWAPERVAIAEVRDLHAVWRDPDGGVWAVGGELSSPSSAGLLLHKGATVSSVFSGESTP